MKPASSGDTTDTGEDSGHDPGLDPADTADFGFQANPAPTYPSGLADTTTVDNNEAWLKRGTEWAGLTGVATPGNAQLALQHYLNGDDLTWEEGQIRDAVIRQFGAPPESVTIGSTGAEPAKRQGTPPTQHTVKGSTDNDYTSLIRLYYGGVTNDKVDLLQAANMSLGSKGPFPVGTRVMIPAYHAPVYHIVKSKSATLSEIAAKHGTSVAVLRVLNDGISNTVKKGKKVRIA